MWIFELFPKIPFIYILIIYKTEYKNCNINIQFWINSDILKMTWHHVTHLPLDLRTINIYYTEIDISKMVQ